VAEIALTFDIDWAPDWAIKECADLCVHYSVPATFYATHASGFLEDLKSDNRFEVGIHPNFFPNSSQGKTTEEILDFCMTLAPSAQSMRTHGLMQWTLLFNTIVQQYPSIKKDISLYIPGPSIKPFDYFTSPALPSITRLSYGWEDDTIALNPEPNWSAPAIKKNEAYVFDFHPILIALNDPTLSDYRKICQIEHRLYDLKQEQAVPYVDKKRKGPWTLLRDTLRENNAKLFKKVIDLH